MVTFWVLNLHSKHVVFILTYLFCVNFLNYVWFVVALNVYFDLVITVAISDRETTIKERRPRRPKKVYFLIFFNLVIWICFSLFFFILLFYYLFFFQTAGTAPSSRSSSASSDASTALSRSPSPARAQRKVMIIYMERTHRQEHDYLLLICVFRNQWGHWVLSWRQWLRQTGRQYRLVVVWIHVYSSLHV